MTVPQEAITEAAIDAAMAACPDQQITLGLWEPAISRKDMRRVLVAAAPHIAADAVAAERERCAQRLDDYAGNYPEDVFPPDGTSPDAIGGTAMRHAYRNAAALLRQEAS